MIGRMALSDRSARKVVGAHKARRVPATEAPTGRKASGILASLTPMQVQAMLARQAAAATRMTHSPTAPPSSPRPSPEDDGLITITYFDAEHPQGLEMGKVTPERLAEMQATWPEQPAADPVELERVRKHVKAVFAERAAIAKAANYEQE
jgi:hypothetical protein